MVIADEQVVIKYGTGVQRDTQEEYDLHQGEAREPQGMGFDVGELRPDCSDEGDQGPHIMARRYRVFLHGDALVPTQIPQPTSGGVTVIEYHKQCTANKDLAEEFRYKVGESDRATNQ